MILQRPVARRTATGRFRLDGAAMGSIRVFTKRISRPYIINERTGTIHFVPRWTVTTSYGASGRPDQNYLIEVNVDSLCGCIDRWSECHTILAEDIDLSDNEDVCKTCLKIYARDHFA